MSDLLNIGASGLRAYSNALAATSENIVNANTEGYSRRSVILEESAVSNGNSLLYRPQTTFGGVNTAGVARAGDEFRVAASRLAMSDSGNSDSRLIWLNQVEINLDNGIGGVGKRLTAVFNAADALAANPNEPLLRAGFLSTLDGAASAFRNTATDLQQTSVSITDQAQSLADSINADLANLQKTNVELRRAGVNTSAYAQMADQRDRLLDNLSSKIGIKIGLDNAGAATVSLAGSTGTALLNGEKFNFVGVDVAANGRLQLTTTDDAGPVLFSAQGGQLQGLVDVAGIVADRRQELDQLAGDFATQINTWSAAGIDANGDPGADLLSPTGGAIAIQALTMDTAKVPAALAGGAANGNLLTLSSLRGTGGVEARWNSLVTGNAQLVAAAKSNNSIVSARLDAANTSRDAASGVDLDREAADLLRYQQAYSASAQVIKTAREAIQTILGML